MPRLPSHPKHHYTLTPCERALCVSIGRLVVAAVDLALSVEDATPDCARGGAAGKAVEVGGKASAGGEGRGRRRALGAVCVLTGGLEALLGVDIEEHLDRVALLARLESLRGTDRPRR